tara:strand:- start:49 stop:333 length:285 start_codon:yes stop_codon:yes gene_type:complete
MIGRTDEAYNCPSRAAPTVMADINIEKFYQHIGKILSILYAEFPSKTPLYVDDVAGIDTPDEYGLHSPDLHRRIFRHDLARQRGLPALLQRYDP